MSLAEKYRPKKYGDFIEQKKSVEEVKNFLEYFPNKKALILYGPAGTGKTSMVLAAANESDLEILELNASDLRNRQSLEEKLKPATEQKALFKKGKIILMDEVDGVTGTDIGGIPELVKLINSTRFPVIMTCNDVWQSKLAPVRAKSKLVEFKPISIAGIISYLASVAKFEELDKDLLFFRKLATKAQGDLRAAINDLESYSLAEDLDVDEKDKRDIEENIFNILSRLFKERKDFLDLFEKSSLSLDQIFLWIEENIPREYKDKVLARAYYALANADIFRGRIYKNQSWRFLVYQNVFQSAGVSYAKDTPLGGFTRYEKPKRILKIWLNNQKMVMKKTIAKRYAKFVHCSTRRIMRDFEILKPILMEKSVQRKLKFSDEEIDFLKR